MYLFNLKDITSVYGCMAKSGYIKKNAKVIDINMMRDR